MLARDRADPPPLRAVRRRRARAAAGCSPRCWPPSPSPPGCTRPRPRRPSRAGARPPRATCRPGDRARTPTTWSTARLRAGHACPTGSTDDAVGRTLAAPLRAGEPVTDVRLVGPALAAGAPGADALPVRLPDAGMVGAARAGDRIDLIATDPQGGRRSVVAADVTGARDPATARRTEPAAVGRARWSWSARAARGDPTSAEAARDVVPDLRLQPLACRRRISPAPLGVAREECTMTGFKNFILRGNLVELAVASSWRRVRGRRHGLLGMLTDLIAGRRHSETSPTTRGDSFGAFLNAADLVRDHGGGRLLLRRHALHQGEGEVLPQPGAGHAGGHRLLEEIRDLLAAAATDRTAGDRPGRAAAGGSPFDGRQLLSRGAAAPAPQPVVALAGARPRRGRARRCVVLRQPSPKTAASRLRRFHVGLRSRPASSVACRRRSCAEARAIWPPARLGRVGLSLGVSVGAARRRVSTASGRDSPARRTRLLEAAGGRR